MEAEEPGANLHAVIQRRKHLFVDPGLYDDDVDDGLDEIVARFIELQLLADVDELTVDARTSVTGSADGLEKIVIVFVENFGHWRADFDLAAKR